ncbi:hypothetical protein BG004_007038 [Podila humilis]|nr:hypothetical protein BG004_007038 [Podila humilis]
MPPMMGGMPPMYPPHLGQGPPHQPYHPLGGAPPPHMQMPPHYQQQQRPPPGHQQPPLHMPHGVPPYGVRGPPPMSQHRVSRPSYGSAPPSAAAIAAPTSAGARPPSGTGVAFSNASAFVIGGALPDKMNTLFIGSIAPGISNTVMEKLLKTTGNLTKWKRVQDPTSQQWKAFGFAEYGDADSLLRTLRVLGQHGQQPKGEKPVGLELTAMDGSGVVKKLLVNADEKTRQFLDQYEEARPRTIHDTEKDKVALVNAKKIIQQMKDGTLDLTENEENDASAKDSTGTNVKEHTAKPLPGDILAAAAISASETAEEKNLSEEQKELIARELTFFRERAAVREREKKEEEERANRHKSGGRQQHHHRDRDHRDHKDSESSSNSRGGRRMDFVPASGANHIEITAPAMGSSSMLSSEQDPAVDSDEEERVRQERKERELEQSYKDRERRWEQREAERARLYERDKVRDEEYAAETVGLKEAMGHRFAQWNDDVERERRHEDYYRDRSRWWQKRQTFLQKEERYDAQDREDEKAELEQEAKKAQVEAAVKEAAEAEKTKEEEKEAIATASTETTTEEAQQAPTNVETVPDATSISPTEAAAVPTSIKLNLATSGLKRGSNNSSTVADDGSQQGTPLAGAMGSSEFDSHEDDREVKKRRVLVPLEYSDDEDEKTTKSAGTGATATGSKSAEESKLHEQQIKDLIQSIPADAEGLWKWPIQWQYVTEDTNNNGSSVIRDKIQPFVAKKVVELLGVQEDELTSFVVEHIRKKQPPQALVDELRNALDNDADVLVMKTWRMLIFETESRARQLTSK